MRTLLSALVLSAAAAAQAQTCSVLQLDTNIAGYGNYHGVALLPAGELLIPYNTDYPSGDLILARADASGDFVWQSRKKALNPAVLLWGNRVELATNGDLIAFGGRTNLTTTSENSFIIRMDSSGNTNWGRIYHGWIHSVEEMSDDGLLIAAMDTVGVLIKTDEFGVPVWGTREGPVPGTGFTAAYMTSVEKATNGDFLFCSWDGTDMVIRRLDPSGVSQSAVTVQAGGNYIYWDGLIEMNNGDLMLACHAGWPDQGSKLIRLDNSGTLLYAVEFDELIGGMVETPTGNLVCTAKLNSDLMLVELSASLQPLSMWDLGTVVDEAALLPLNGDTVRVIRMDFDNPTFQATMLKATPPYDLSCVGSSLPLPVAAPATVSIVPAGVLLPDTMRNWEMALLEMDPMTCDANIAASCGTPRPGFSCGFYITVENQGGISTGPLTVTATLDPNFTINSSVPAASTISGNTITWIGQTALPGTGISSFHISASLPPDTALLGQTITTTVTVVQDTTEASTANNSFTFARTVTGSYDPNDKLVFPKDFYHITGDSILDYTIRFQNTGTDTAFNIVVIDTLPPDVDVLTFQAGAASHPYTYSLTGEGLLKFTFNNILLPDSNTNEPLSHGLVNFRIKPIQPIYLGQTISNEADIYFDFNPPARTPPATVVVTDFMALKPAAHTNELKLYPVPARDVLTVEVPKGFLPRNAIITGSDGRAVWSSGVMNAKERLIIPVQNLATGAYTLSLLSKHGDRSQARFVKE